MGSQEKESLYIGVDVGGTKIAGLIYKGAYEPRNPQVDIVAEYEVPARPGVENLLEDVMTVVQHLLDEADALAGTAGESQKQLEAIGIGTPGVVDSTTGAVDNIGNLQIDHIELGKGISERAGVPVVVENDVNAATLGANALLKAARSTEGTHGIDDADDCSTTVFLNLGTGLGAGVLRFGALDHGSYGNVGEVGHIPVEPHGYVCGCGQRGCLETAASGGGAKKLWPYDDPPMPALISKAHNADVEDHEQAQETLQTIITAIANAIMALAVTVDPDTIIIGGGMARTGEPLLEEIRKELEKNGETSRFVRSMELGNRLVLAPMDKPIGSLGAGVAAQQALAATYYSNEDF